MRASAIRTPVPIIANSFVLDIDFSLKFEFVRTRVARDSEEVSVELTRALSMSKDLEDCWTLSAEMSWVVEELARLVRGRILKQARRSKPSLI